MCMRASHSNHREGMKWQEFTVTGGGQALHDEYYCLADCYFPAFENQHQVSDYRNQYCYKQNSSNKDTDEQPLGIIGNAKLGSFFFSKIARLPLWIEYFF